MTAQVWARTESYLVDLLCPPDPDLAEALRVSAAAGLPDISVSALQGKQISMLASMAGARRILEIGSLGGYSTLWLAKTLPPDGSMTTIENNPVHASTALANIASAGFSDRVTVRLGNAAEQLEEMAEVGVEPFDFFFVDADQHNNLTYVEGCLRLARRGSVLVLDNVVRQGEISDETANPAIQATQRVLETVGPSSAVDAVVFQTVGVRGHDGMLVLRVL